MNNILKIVIAVNLIVITVLVFIYPQLMIAPGKLIASHQQLETDCFACHAPLSGVASERCITCHKTADIGRLLTTGQAIAKPRTSTPFHQELNSQDCVACHSDRRKHVEEGIRNFDNCVQCHRSGNEHDRRDGDGERHGEKDDD